MSEVSHRDQTSQDIGVVLFFLVWAGVGWASLATDAGLFEKLYGRDPGPALMPIIVLGILTAGGLGLAINPALALFSGRGKLRAQFSPNWRTIAFFVSVTAFPAGMEIIGYVPTTLAFVFVWSMLLTPHIRQRPAQAATIAAIAAVATTLVIHLGFDLIIGAQLP